MLTPKQEKFCLEFAASGNIYHSAIKAGYSENYAKGNIAYLLDKESVKKRLQELREKIENEKIADIKEMQETLTKIIRQQTKEQVIVVEGQGDGFSEAKTMQKEPSVNDVIKAINTLGKMQGAFVEKMNANVDMDLNIKIDYGDSNE